MVSDGSRETPGLHLSFRKYAVIVVIANIN